MNPGTGSIYNPLNAIRPKLQKPATKMAMFGLVVLTLLYFFDEFDALGGECELYGIDVDASSLQEGRAWILRMHDRLTRFEPTSELSKLNASGGRWSSVSPELETLLRDVGAESRQAVDPTELSAFFQKFATTD